jgi:excisionase family DNA binding protein
MVTDRTISPVVGFDLSLLLTVEETATLLRLGRTQTYELVMLGKIQSVKIGRRRLVVRDSLQDFISHLLDEQN